MNTIKTLGPSNGSLRIIRWLLVQIHQGPPHFLNRLEFVARDGNEMSPVEGQSMRARWCGFERKKAGQWE